MPKPKPEKQKPLNIKPLEIRAMEVKRLKAAGYNPREIKKPAMKGLRASVEKFGMVEPIVWNKRTGRVVGGHQRLKVLREMGTAKTQVVVVDLGEKDEKALNLALNNPGLQGQFTGAVADIISELRLAMPDVHEALRMDEIGAVVGMFAIDGVGAPALRGGDRSPFQQMTFTLHDSQAEIVKAAVVKAQGAGHDKSEVNENGNGNALAAICEAYNGRC